MDRITLITKSSPEYGLLDSGREEKLERFGNVVLARPDPQALWEKNLSHETWGKANGKYLREKEEGKWVGKLEKEWQIEFGDLNFLIKPTSFKHVGLFPEQLPNWEWVKSTLERKLASHLPSAEDGIGVSVQHVSAPAPAILNLFAYTGGATLAAAQAGAEVTHVDASKTAVAWARENAAASGLADKPIRWITEDVLVFVKREIKRGKKYDAIIMDPPAFGHGPKNELWKIEENLLELMQFCSELLSDNPLFVLINGYAEGYSSLVFAYNLEKFEKKYGGTIEYGDLTIEEKGSGRLLPAGIFARCCFK
jgi:23S rRNA (cytosine1962-C5)-methyltransferase